MVLVGVILLLLGGLFLFAAVTGMPRDILGVKRETPVMPEEKADGRGDDDSAQGPVESQPPETVEWEDSPFADADYDEWSTPSEDAETASEAPRITSPEQPSPEIPVSRRVSSAALGIVGMAAGIVALLDTSL